MTANRSDEINRYLQTGDHDVLYSAWPGTAVVDRAVDGSRDLAAALVSEVRSREATVSVSDTPQIPGGGLVAFTRSKVKPMVKGLFRRDEVSPVLALLERSVAFLTQENIEQLIRDADPHTAWVIANTYLGSVEAERISDEAPNVVGVSVEATCYVSLEYFKDENPFADYVIHEAAHVFHNTKRQILGLKETKRRQWLLPIEYTKRETFAYSCEAYSRICERAKNPTERRAQLDLLKQLPPPTDDCVDEDEYFTILADAVDRRNGWKAILEACSAV